MTRPPLRVIKLGGSLLDQASLGDDLPAWLSAQTPAWNVLIVGGGPMADAVRSWDLRFDLGPSVSHWLCVDGMSLTARLVANLLPQARYITQFKQLCDLVQERLPTSDCLVFDVADFLRRIEPQCDDPPLSCDWTVTSDSIAARLAQVLGADELVLLKSTDAPPGLPHEWAAANYVDEHFPRASRTLRRIRAVNFRSSDWNEREIGQDSVR